MNCTTKLWLPLFKMSLVSVKQSFSMDLFIFSKQILMESFIFCAVMHGSKSCNFMFYWFQTFTWFLFLREVKPTPAFHPLQNASTTVIWDGVAFRAFPLFKQKFCTYQFSFAFTSPVNFSNKSKSFFIDTFTDCRSWMASYWRETPRTATLFDD